jgi:Tol biopolymer transport system component
LHPTPDERIVVFSANGKRLRVLPATHWNGYSLPDYDPTWSPDGRRLAFEAYPGPEAGSSWIEVSNADGSGRHVLTDRSGDCAFEHPSWSPNGLQIALDISNRLYVLNANGRNQHALPPK